MRNLLVAERSVSDMEENAVSVLPASVRGQFVRNAEAEDRNAEPLSLSENILCTNVYRSLVRKEKNQFQPVHTRCATSAMHSTTNIHGLRYLLVRSSPLRMPLCAA